jgi:thioredoxin reductase
LGGQLHDYSLPVMDLPGFIGDAPQLVATLTRQLDQWQVPVWLECHAESYDVQARRLTVSGGRSLACDWVIYAPGLRARQLVCPGAELIRDASVSTLIHQGPWPRPVLVVGGGDRALEAGLRLRRAGVSVTVLHRGEQLVAQRRFRTEAQSAGIALVANAQIERVQLEHDGYRVTWSRRGVRQDAVFARILVRIGMEPNVREPWARIQEGIAVPRMPRLTVIGDAALPVWERSLVSAYASAMRALKRLSLDP